MITVTDNAVKRIKFLLNKHECEGGSVLAFKVEGARE